MTKASGLSRPGLRRVLVSVIVVIILIAIQPALWDWVGRSAEELHNRRTLAGQLANLQDQLAQLKTEQGSAQTVQDQLDAVLISREGITQAVERIESQAQGIPVTLRVHNIETQSEGGKIDSLVITATATASVDKLLQYLETIENLAEITSINNFLLRPAPRPVGAVGEFNDFSLDFNVAFATEAEPGTTTEQEKSRFTSVATPTPPAPSFVSRLGTMLIYGSLVVIIGLLGYRIYSKRKRRNG